MPVTASTPRRSNAAPPSGQSPGQPASHAAAHPSRAREAAPRRAIPSQVSLLWESTSPAMQRLLAQIERVAPTDVTMLAVGESGSGKEVVARAVHERSARRKGPFIAVNCGAIQPTLIESELFGHEKGGFTGAIEQKAGYFEQAHGGTLFLDEVTEMPLEMQIKLLRVLEGRTFHRVGGDTPIATDVRILAATNRDPVEAARAGQLREDLLYRLAVFPLHIPPLRERPDDIVPLARHFLAEYNAMERTDKAFSAASLERLVRYDWPGNVRELKNAVYRAHPGRQGRGDRQPQPGHAAAAAHHGGWRGQRARRHHAGRHPARDHHGHPGSL